MGLITPPLVSQGEKILVFYHQDLAGKHTAGRGHGWSDTTCDLSLCTLEKWNIREELQHRVPVLEKKKLQNHFTNTSAVDS